MGSLVGFAGVSMSNVVFFSLLGASLFALCLLVATGKKLEIGLSFSQLRLIWERRRS